MRDNVRAAVPMAGAASRPAEGGRARHRGLALGLVLLAQLLVVIDVSIVTLALRLGRCHASDFLSGCVSGLGTEGVNRVRTIRTQGGQ